MQAGQFTIHNGTRSFASLLCDFWPHVVTISFKVHITDSGQEGIFPEVPLKVLDTEALPVFKAGLALKILFVLCQEFLKGGLDFPILHILT